MKLQEAISLEKSNNDGMRSVSISPHKISQKIFCIKAGTNYRIIGAIFVPTSPLRSKPAKPDYLMFAKDIVSDFPVVWGVLRAIFATRNTVVCGVL